MSKDVLKKEKLNLENKSSVKYMDKQQILKGFKKKYPKKNANWYNGWTKQFKKYNKDLLREGETNTIVFDDTKVYNKTTDRFINKKTFFTEKGKPRDKFKKDYEFKGKVIVNRVVRDDRLDDAYIKTIMKDYQSKKNNKYVRLDLEQSKFVGKEYNVEKVLKLLNKLNQTEGKRVVIHNGVSYITIKPDTINKVSVALSNEVVEGTAGKGSDIKMVYDIIWAKKRFDIIVRDKIKVKTKAGGNFFPYTHKLDKVDLSRYAVFKTVKEKNYKTNCLCHALETAGYDIQPIKILVRNQRVPMCKLKQVAELLGCCITVNRIEDKSNNITKYGDETKPLVKLGIIKEHYFLIEKTIYTRYSIENYEDVKNKRDFNMLSKNGKRISIRRDRDRSINSYDLIKILVSNEKQYLEPITKCSELYKTIYNNKVDDIFTNLDYNEDLNLKENIPKKKSLIEIAETYYFDFETTTTAEKEYTLVKDNNNPYHTPYCCYTDKHPNGFWGVNCGRNLLRELAMIHGGPKDDIPTIRLIAHNSSYDFRFLINYLYSIKSIEKGKSLVVANAMFSYNGYYIKIEIKDSLKMINMGLAKFGKTFDLEQEKEIMPYDLYTEENIEKQFIDKHECLTYVKEKDKDKYLENCIKLDCIDDDDNIDILKYAGWYCYKDCMVLKLGYEKFNSFVNEATGQDINEYLTLASMAHDYLIIKGCYDDVLQISGVPRAFIQKCVVGGRTMCANNKKAIRDIDYADYDGVSLYPASMVRMEGFLTGKPHIIENFEPEKYDGYFIRIKITELNIKRNFPLCSFMSDKGVRMFSNDMVGREIYIDKIALEDLVKFQGVKYEFLQGYYYDEGHNPTINKVMEHLFNQRLKYKNMENPIQIVFKELMNSSYGKSSLKPIDNDSVYRKEDEVDEYVDKYFDFVKEYTQIANTKYYKIKVDKAINNHFNNVHVGVEILSMSKRIMNEVMCLAEDLTIDMTYQDTDSIHMPLKDVSILEKEFNKKYNRTLTGKDLGQFHVDFDLEGSKKGAEIKSIKSIFLGKKCYIDKLQSIDKDNKIIYDYHIRMKGVSEDCIIYKAEKEYDGDVFRIYEDLYNRKYTGSGDKKVNSFEGKKQGLQFNLTAVRPNFRMTKDMRVISEKDFFRKIDYDKPINC